MFARQKNWISGGLWKPKNPHSLEHLKYLHNVLGKNQTVTEQNRSLLVETLRSISEILIWGDQNDSSVFDFFLEKNMLSFFLRFMRQKSGRYICVQLLQTLNILFENISNETSVYYLLSNNHINSIIVHKFDFSDEEVMAYYISFLKTLSLKLNKHTIHFFYNEHTNDFALYTEAIKFFNHPETMVRIAVRTITLNVYKVDEKSMLRYIRDKTAAPYFSNLVWFIGNHVLELDICVRHDIDHNSRGRLSDLVAEHLDHLHYLNDILCLNIDALNEVLTDHLLNRLLIPLYVYSLTKRKRYAPRSDDQPHVSSVVSLFFLSQVFLIMHHPPLVMQLADIILNGDLSVCKIEQPSDSPQTGRSRVCGFIKPSEPLAKTLDQVRGASRKKPSKRPNYKEDQEPESTTETAVASTSAETSHQTGEAQSQARDSHIYEGNSTFYNPDADQEEMEGTEESSSEADKSSEATSVEAPCPPALEDDLSSPNQNSTDEEKLLHHLSGTTEVEFTLTNRPYLNAIFVALEVSDNDYEALFGLCLLYAMGHNNGIHQDVLDTILMPTQKSSTKGHYNIALIEKIINILSKSCQNGSRVRLATLELSILLLKTMVYKETQCYLQDRHLAALEGAREEATLQLRNFYKSEEIFLDMFEDEFREMQNRPLNVEYLTMDASILLPPTGTPLTGIDFNKRLPCGEVERARKAIRVFFHMRDLSLTLRHEQETQLPLTRVEECVRKGDVLDLNNSDLIACTVITKENKKERRFLVIDVLQLILVEPDSHKLGWGVVKFVGFLQDVEVTGDKEDSRSLHITIHKPATNMHARPIPLLSARFLFDDHIRCMAAKQRLTKGRLRARQRKMQMIARLLELPTHIVESMYQPASSSGSMLSAATLRTSSSTSAIPGRSHPVTLRSAPVSSDSHPPLLRTHSEVLQRSVFSAVETTAAFQTARDQNVTANTRQLPRHLAASRQISRPIAIRGSRPGAAARQRPVQGNIQRVMEEAGVEVLGGITTENTEAAVDEAEEATPSPEAHARLSLNPSQPGSPAPDTRGNHSRSSSTESTSSRGPQEIQMEDLSQRGRRTTTPTRHDPSALSSVRRHSSPLVEDHRSRSGSASPKRGRRGAGSPAPRGRGVQTTRSATKDLTKHKSDPKPADPNSVEVTSFIRDSEDSTANKKPSSSQKKRPKRQLSGGRRGSGTSGCPKSLTPAQEPSVSLVTSCTPPKSSDTQHVGSPKLLPPAEADRPPSQPDASSSTPNSDLMSSETSNTSQSSQMVVADQNRQSKPPFLITSQTQPTVGESPITADLTRLERVAPPSESTSQQLSKLADMVAPPGESTSHQLSNLPNIVAPPGESTSEQTPELDEEAGSSKSKLVPKESID